MVNFSLVFFGVEEEYPIYFPTHSTHCLLVLSLPKIVAHREEEMMRLVLRQYTHTLHTLLSTHTHITYIPSLSTYRRYSAKFFLLLFLSSFRISTLPFLPSACMYVHPICPALLFAFTYIHTYIQHDTPIQHDHLPTYLPTYPIRLLPQNTPAQPHFHFYYRLSLSLSRHPYLQWSTVP